MVNGTNPEADKSIGLFCQWTGMHARTHMRLRACVRAHLQLHALLINGIFEAIKVSCKHMKANQLVRGVYYRGFNTDLGAALRSQWL